MQCGTLSWLTTALRVYFIGQFTKIQLTYCFLPRFSHYAALTQEAHMIELEIFSRGLLAALIFKIIWAILAANGLYRSWKNVARCLRKRRVMKARRDRR